MEFSLKGLVHISKVGSFIKNNEGSLWVKIEKEFCKKQWGLKTVSKPFKPVLKSKGEDVFISGDNYCFEYEDDLFVGYKVRNALGVEIIAIKKRG